MTIDAKQLYTEKLDAYLRFNSAFRYPQALRAFFETSDLLRPDLRILDAGCGTGIATFALLRAMAERSLRPSIVHGFDLTPAMLARFRQTLEHDEISGVQLTEADVLYLNSLPESWTGYDLIVSASMLEYLPRDGFVPALSALRSRLAPEGRLLIIITRKNWMNKWLIEKMWHAIGYTRSQLRAGLITAGFQQITFRRFPRRYFWQNFWGHIVQAGTT